MPQQPISIQGLHATDIKTKIELLIDNLINIKDESGKFLLRLPDGRVIDTKGWNDWEWTYEYLISLTLLKRIDHS